MLDGDKLKWRWELGDGEVKWRLGQRRRAMARIGMAARWARRSWSAERHVSRHGWPSLLGAVAVGASRGAAALRGAVGEERRCSVVRWERSGARVRAEERRSVEKKKKKPPKIGQKKTKKT
jgi:hypothetical protein